ncbi:hypothetical protein BJX64DRAFT_276724 [Aspergillus heterothallicus]
MADPFSVVASAAGLISLGIESCKLIAGYCDGVRGFDEQIESVALKADGLISTLQQISLLLHQTDKIHPDIASDIKEKVLQNRNWIAKLNERVERLSVTTSSTGLGGRIRATAKKAVYPFHKDSLLGTVDILHGLQMNLHTALLALQVQHALAISKQTEIMQRLESLVITKMEQQDSSVGRMRFKVASTWLGLEIEATVQISRVANALSISPNLSFHGIVSKDSPAFKLFYDSLFHCFSSREEAVCGLNNITRDLQRLFDQGQASPFDRTADGTTLTHQVACSYYNTVSRCEHIDVYGILFDFLAKSGCLINETNARGIDPLKMILPIDRDGECSMHLLKIGATVSDHHLGHLSPGNLKSAWLMNQENFFLSEPANAVMLKSKDGLLDALRCQIVESQDNPEATDGNLFTCSLLWADGIHILHDTGCRITAGQKSDLLYCAVYHDLVDTAIALVKIGAPVSSALVGISKSKEMEKLLIDTLISHGKSILRLATTALPEYIQLKFNLENDRLPDRDAAEICMELENRGVTVDSSLRYFEKLIISEPGALQYDCFDCLIYEPGTLRYNQLEQLYQAGFRDIEELCSDGDEPVLGRSSSRWIPSGQMLQHTLERAMWVVAKGANIDVSMGADQMPLRYLLCLHIVRAMGWDSWNTSRCMGEENEFRTRLGALPVCLSKFMKQAFQDSTDGIWPCHCTAMGFSTLSMAVRVVMRGGLFNGLDDTSYGEYISCEAEGSKEFRIIRIKLLQILVEVVLAGMQERAGTAAGIIQLLTFTDLELTHTCSRIDIDITEVTLFDEEEISEIHEEEKALVDELTSLVTQFESDYHALGLPLWEYIETVWCSRMRVYLVEQGEAVSDNALCMILSKCP